MMDRNSKKEKVDDHNLDSDQLSDLPLSIIHIILALIPIRDAVRTSVLSTQWRYTWITLPQLVFDDECANNDYENFISRVLFFHKGPIQRFRLSCPCLFPNAYQWLTCLSRNGIQKLILERRRAYDFGIKMQSSLYYCEKLTYLKLHCCDLEPPPMNFKGFLFLRCLSTNNCSLTSDDISRIVAGCPLLKSFELIELMEPSELKISSPNLKYMHLVGEYHKICITAPLMTEISVALYYYENHDSEDQELKSSACEYASCFAGFIYLQKLKGRGYFTKFMSLGLELCHLSLVFHHLKLIHVDVNFEDVKEIMVLVRLVIGAPSLQELMIESFESLFDIDSEARRLSLVDLGFAPFKLENLTDVSLVNFGVIPLEAEFLKVLFERSPVLETVRVDTEENQNKVRAILQGCNWASPPTVKLG